VNIAAKLAVRSGGPIGVGQGSVNDYHHEPAPGANSR
jgi:hypothetical protein